MVTYGYPAGGEQISYTRGVVSRIDIQTYVHSGNRALLTVQTDAAINPGNSGGPVVQNDRAVGVAFQGIPGLENAGFFIPTTIMRHFLEDIEDGEYHGFPQAGIRLSNMHNTAYRKFLKLPGIDHGARIDSIVDSPTTEELMRMDDVILKIGSYQVGSDGSVLYDGNRVRLAVAIQEYQHGASVPLTIWRDGQELDIELPVYVNQADKTLGNQNDVAPRYYVYGGLVFTPLSLDYLKTTGRPARKSFTSYSTDALRPRTNNERSRWCLPAHWPTRSTRTLALSNGLWWIRSMDSALRDWRMSSAPSNKTISPFI